MNRRITKNYQFNYDLKQLLAFLEVARTMSFSKAAENLFISQPAISRKIFQLEEAFKCQLFFRSANGIQLTPAGKELQERLPKVLDNLLEITNTLKNSLKSQKLKIGYTCAAISSFLPTLIRETSDDLSKYELVFSEGETTDLIDDVLKGNLDGAFIMSQSRNDDLLTINIRPERLGIMIPEEHPLKAYDEISIEQLKNETLVIFPRVQNPSLYDHIFDCCQSAGFHPKSIKEADGCNAIFGFVAAGIGVAFIAESMSNLCMRGNLYKPISAFAPEIKFSFICKKSASANWHHPIENAIYNNFCDQDCLNCYQFINRSIAAWSDHSLIE